MDEDLEADIEQKARSCGCLAWWLVPVKSLRSLDEGSGGLE